MHVARVREPDEAGDDSSIGEELSQDDSDSFYMYMRFEDCLRRAIDARHDPVKARALLEEAERNMDSPETEAEQLSEAWFWILDDVQRTAEILRKTRNSLDTDVWIRRIKRLSYWLGDLAAPYMLEVLEDARANGNFDVLHETIMLTSMTIPKASRPAIEPFVKFNQGRASTFVSYNACAVAWLYLDEDANRDAFIQCVQAMERLADSAYQFGCCAAMWGDIGGYPDRVNHCIQQSRRRSDDPDSLNYLAANALRHSR